MIAGEAIWYRPDGAEGACGFRIGDNDLAVNLPEDAYTGGWNCHRRV